MAQAGQDGTMAEHNAYSEDEADPDQWSLSSNEELDPTHSAARQPDFYDPLLDDKDERWVDKHRQGRQSDAILSCPGCLTTVCLECQAHTQYEHQFRAVDLVNCRSAPVPV